jgi:hypothetical protein
MSYLSAGSASSALNVVSIPKSKARYCAVESNTKDTKDRPDECWIGLPLLAAAPANGARTRNRTSHRSTWWLDLRAVAG